MALMEISSTFSNVALPEQSARPALGSILGNGVAKSSASQGPKRAPATEPSVVDVQETVNALNELAQNSRRELQFSVHDKSGRTVITVIDSATDEVVRQIPSEEVLDVKERLQSASASLLLDSQA